MKTRPTNKIYGICFVLALTHIPVCAQELALHATYDLSKFSYYQVHEGDDALLTAQDSVKMAPSWTLSHHNDRFYSDGSYKFEAQYSYPAGKLEDWMESISKVVVSPTLQQVYVNDKLAYEFPVEPKPDVQDPKTYTPFYLATDDWQLPLPEHESLDYVSDGYTVLKNDASTFIAKSPKDMVIMDKSTRTETIVQFNETGDETSRTSKHYRVDHDGYIVLDYEEHRSLDRSYTPCMEYIQISQYSNISRVYDEAYAPTEQNGIYHAQASNSSPQTIAIGTDLTKDQLTVLFKPHNPLSIDIAIQDSYGNVVLEAQNVTRENACLNIAQLGMGVYTFIVTNMNYKHVKFIKH